MNPITVVNVTAVQTLPQGIDNVPCGISFKLNKKNTDSYKSVITSNDQIFGDYNI